MRAIPALLRFLLMLRQARSDAPNNEGRKESVVTYIWSRCPLPFCSRPPGWWP